MTPSKEDYLKNILELNGAEEVVSNKDLSQALGVSAASVTEMNNRLLKEDLIDYIPYKGVKLTDTGKQLAYQLIRKHRLWEVFLVEKLNYSYDKVHEEADLLEHVSSDDLINRLEAYLGYPKTDPHGSPIPDRQGNLPAKDERKPLSEFEAGQTVKLLEFIDDSEILYYIKEKGLALGESYTIKSIEPFEGPVRLMDTDGKEYLISSNVTKVIYAEVD